MLAINLPIVKPSVTARRRAAEAAKTPPLRGSGGGLMWGKENRKGKGRWQIGDGQLLRCVLRGEGQWGEVKYDERGGGVGDQFLSVATVTTTITAAIAPIVFTSTTTTTTAKRTTITTYHLRTICAFIYLYSIYFWFFSKGYDPSI